MEGRSSMKKSKLIPMTEEEEYRNAGITKEEIMSDTLTKKEIKKLIELGKKIQLGLSCDINETGLPCRSDRLKAIEDMKDYLSIHNFGVYNSTEERELYNKWILDYKKN